MLTILFKLLTRVSLFEFNISSNGCLRVRVVAEFFTLSTVRHLRVRLEIASVDALDQLLGHLDDLLTACWNRQHIIDQFEARDRHARSFDQRSRLIPTHRTAQQSHARIFINFYVLRQRLSYTDYPLESISKEKTKMKQRYHRGTSNKILSNNPLLFSDVCSMEKSTRFNRTPMTRSSNDPNLFIFLNYP